MRPFFTYYGGKYRAASRYPKPQGGVIVEPFAGAAGYSVRNYHPATRVVLNDLDERVAATWTYLTRAASEEIMRLPLYDGTWETAARSDLVCCGFCGSRYCLCSGLLRRFWFVWSVVEDW